MVWFDYRDRNHEIYYKRSIDAGTSWGQDTRLTNDDNYSYYPSVASSGSYVHVVWYDFRDGNAEIYYKRSVDAGLSWCLDTRLTNDSHYSSYPSVAISGSIVHVVWSDRRDGLLDIYYKRGADMQPDNLVKNSSESVYMGDGIYNDDGSDQTNIKTVSLGKTAFYHIRIANDAGLSDSIKVSANGSADGWMVKYFDALNAGTDITSDITGVGWSTWTLDPDEFKEIRVEVTPTDNLQGDSVYDVLITSTSNRETTKLDAVKATTVLVTN